MSTAECKICCRQYDEDVEERTPRILTSCGHTICEECAKLLTRNGHVIACPFDRKITAITLDGVKCLQKNFALLELSRGEARKMESLGKKADNPCFENPSHEAVFYCQQCEVDLCASCFSYIHKSKVLALHQKIKISEKPIKLPQCPKHPYTNAEFLCTDQKCLNPIKTLCHTCTISGVHKWHSHDLLMKQLLKNEQTLKEILERLKLHQRRGMMYIQKLEKNLESFDVSGAAFKNAAKAISDEFDLRKKEALCKLNWFVNDSTKTQTALKRRLKEDYGRSQDLREVIEKKLRTKNDLHEIDEIAKQENSQRFWDVSPKQLDGLNNQKFLIPTMDLQIKSESNFEKGVLPRLKKSYDYVCIFPELFDVEFQNPYYWRVARRSPRVH